MSEEQQKVAREEVIALFDQIWDGPEIIHLHPFRDFDLLLQRINHDPNNAEANNDTI